MASPRSELIQLQKRLYRANRQRILGSIHIEDPKFKRYEKQYQHAVSRFQKVSTQEAMLKEVVASDLVYVGDYHTCPQSQRSFLRILKAIQKQSRRPLLLCLELFHRSMQPIVDGYLTGRVSEQVFLKRIKLHERWVFDLWPNFKPILDFAKYHHIPVVGIEVAPDGASLEKRDRETGNYIAQLSKDYPDHHLMVLIGDLHLAPAHLPSHVNKGFDRLKIERKSLTLYQNSEAIYWKLAKRGLVETVEVTQINASTFCIMNTPPIVCQQSYLNWLEHEEGEIDYADARQNFLDLVKRISQFLGIKVGRNADNVEVYTCGDLSFLKRLRSKKHFSESEIKLIKSQILASESYFIPKIPLVYLANLSLNHAAEEASHYLKFLCTGEEKPRPLVDAFYANILHEALGFFGSKLMNPKRKCFHLPEFKSLIRYFKTHAIPKDRELELYTAHLLVDYMVMEGKGRALEAEAVFHQPHHVFFALTHALGYILGDKLFYGLMSNVVRKSELKALFNDSWRKQGAPFATYRHLVETLKHVKIPKRL